MTDAFYRRNKGAVVLNARKVLRHARLALKAYSAPSTQNCTPTAPPFCDTASSSASGGPAPLAENLAETLVTPGICVCIYAYVYVHIQMYYVPGVY
jgi:hypothetical protein